VPGGQSSPTSAGTTSIMAATRRAYGASRRPAIAARPSRRWPGLRPPGRRPWIGRPVRRSRLAQPRGCRPSMSSRPTLSPGSWPRAASWKPMTAWPAPPVSGWWPRPGTRLACHSASSCGCGAEACTHPPARSTWTRTSPSGSPSNRCPYRSASRRCTRPLRPTGMTPTGTRCPETPSPGPPGCCTPWHPSPAPRPRRHPRAPWPLPVQLRLHQLAQRRPAGHRHRRIQLRHPDPRAARTRWHPDSLRRRPRPEPAPLARRPHHHVRPDWPPADHHRARLQPRYPPSRVPRHQDPPARRPATRGVAGTGDPGPGRRLAAAGRTAQGRGQAPPLGTGHGTRPARLPAGGPCCRADQATGAPASGSGDRPVPRRTPRRPAGRRRTAARRRTEWIDWIAGYRQEIDPFRQSPVMPAVRDPSPEDLRPFLNGWSPYGPDAYR